MHIHKLQRNDGTQKFFSNGWGKYKKKERSKSGIIVRDIRL